MSRLGDVLDSLSECLCAQFEKDGVDPPCFCGLVPGANVAHDYGGSACNDRYGMAYLRVANMFPSTTVGQQDFTLGNCGALLTVSVEIGVIRPFIIASDTNAEPPSVEETGITTHRQIEDAMLMLRAVKCCDALTSKDYVMTTYTPVGPLGGMVGGLWNLLLGV